MSVICEIMVLICFSNGGICGSSVVQPFPLLENLLGAMGGFVEEQSPGNWIKNPVSAGCLSFQIPADVPGMGFFMVPGQSVISGVPEHTSSASFYRGATP